jgi:hypothetical protein
LSNISALRCSITGQYIFIADTTAGTYISSDHGANFVTRVIEPNNLVISYSGQYVLLGESSVRINYSTDYGNTFSYTSDFLISSDRWNVAISAEGRYMFAMSDTISKLAWSTNSGTSWQSATPGGATIKFNHMFCSSDGDRLLLYNNTTYDLYILDVRTISSTYSLTLISDSCPGNCQMVTSDNLDIIVLYNSTGIHINYNYGRGSWSTHNITGIKSVTISRGGRNIVATTGSSLYGLYTLGNFISS